MSKHSRRVRGWWLAVALSGLLVACGGGGDAPPTVVPENLAISAPSAAESGATVRFASSTGQLDGLKYSWDFGDGSTSAEAAPSHSFANAGEFEVVLKVSNEVGTSRAVRSKLSITNLANVHGLVCSGADSTGWCWQNPRPTGNRVNAVFFLDANLGWRAGDAGEIFKTADGGATWVKQNTGITSAIQGIAFLDAQTGWATGAFGAVLRTTDGGSTWKVDKFPDANGAPYDANTITPVDASTVYVGRVAIGNNGYSSILLSTDGGVNWRAVTPAPAAVVKGGKLWVIDGNAVKRSVDGGKSYATVLSLQTAPGYYYFDSISLSARDDLHATVMASQSTYDFNAQKYVYKYSVNTTQDGGATWLTVDGSSLGAIGSYPRLLSASGDGMALNALVSSNTLVRSVDGGQNWTSLGPLDPSNFYGPTITALGGDVLAAIGYGGLFLSEDGGQTWPKLQLPAGVETYMVSSGSVRRADAQTLLLTDNSGNTYLSKDKGASWAALVAANTNAYQALAVAFRDAKNGFMVDEKGRSLASSDGGATWQVRRTDFGSVNSLQFVNKQVGWLVGNDGRLYQSTDGGANWLTGPAAQGVYYTSVKFEDEQLGWSRRSAAGSYGLWATQDGGKNWALLNLPGNIVSMRLGTAAWVAGGSSGEIYVSTDKGATWKPAFSGTYAYLYALAFSDAKTVWAVGHDGTLLKSDDASISWTSSKPAGINSLRDIQFVNAKVGWIVGDNGLILATADGGKTWRPQPSGTALTLTSIQAVDVNTAWVNGLGGVLLATGNGGN